MSSGEDDPLRITAREHQVNEKTIPKRIATLDEVYYSLADPTSDDRVQTSYWLMLAEWSVDTYRRCLDLLWDPSTKSRNLIISRRGGHLIAHWRFRPVRTHALVERLFQKHFLEGQILRLTPRRSGISKDRVATVLRGATILGSDRSVMLADVYAEFYNVDIYYLRLNPEAKVRLGASGEYSLTRYLQSRREAPSSGIIPQ